jgi:hypothetical protein
MRNISIRFFFLLLAVFFIALSCNNQSEPSTPSEEKKPTDTASKKEASSDFLGTGEFSHLAILKTDLDHYFLPPGQGGLNARKIVFRFTHDGGSNSNIVIEGFVTNPGNNNYLTGTLVTFEELPIKASFASQKIHLSDLELRKTDYFNLPNPGANTHLIFSPFRYTSGDNIYCVSYRLSWGTPTTFTGTTEALAPDELHPSPPANPGN